MGASFRRMLPASLGYTPVSTLISVDLPAPFCPISACTSPANRRRPTPCSTRTPKKLLAMPDSSNTGLAARALILVLFVLVVDVDEHRGEQHQALNDLLIVDADAEDGHAVVHHAHHEG